MAKRIPPTPERAEVDAFLGRMYRRLVGATVLEFRWAGEYPIFTVRLANGERREIGIWQDAEGNGGGFVSGLED